MCSMLKQIGWANIMLQFKYPKKDSPLYDSIWNHYRQTLRPDSALFQFSFYLKYYRSAKLLDSNQNYNTLKRPKQTYLSCIV